MHNAIPLSVAALIAVSIILIGCFYLAAPQRILGSFGLRPPADTRAWLRLKGTGRRIRPGRVDHDADREQPNGGHGSARPGHHSFWRHVQHSGVGRVEVEGGLGSWRDLRGHAVVGLLLIHAM